MKSMTSNNFFVKLNHIFILQKLNIKKNYLQPKTKSNKIFLH